MGKSNNVGTKIKLTHPVVDRIFDSAPKSMPWKKWLKTAMDHQLRIINWPATMTPPGPTFDFKKVTAEDLAGLVADYIDHKRGGESSLDSVPGIESWTDGKYLFSDKYMVLTPPLEEKAYTDDATKGEIPLVVTPGGAALWQVSDALEWEEKAENAKKNAKKRSRSVASNHSKVSRSRDVVSDVEMTDDEHKSSSRHKESSRSQTNKVSAERARKPKVESRIRVPENVSSDSEPRHSRQHTEDKKSHAPSQPTKKCPRKEIDAVSSSKKQGKSSHRDAIVIDNSDVDERGKTEGRRKAVHDHTSRDKERSGHRSRRHRSPSIVSKAQRGDREPGCTKEKSGHQSRRRSPSVISSSDSHPSPPFTQSSSHQDTRPAKRARHEEREAHPAHKNPRNDKGKVGEKSKPTNGHRYKTVATTPRGLSESESEDASESEWE
jgi:hypothetical protein